MGKTSTRRSSITAAHLVVAAALTIVGVTAVASPRGSAAYELVLGSSLALLVAAALWARHASVVLRRELESRSRRIAQLEQDRAAALPSGHSEQFHEARSTVAGIRAAHEMCQRAELTAAQRSRLAESMTTELARLEQLFRPPTHERPKAPISVDAALSALATNHRARGHQVDWMPSGTTVPGRAEDLATAVNILLENSVAHASGARSRIEVRGDDAGVEIRVSDDGPGIRPELRASIFERGVTTSTTDGQGIGLHMARRLVADQGGSLSLTRPVHGEGAAFAIRIPAPRVSPDGHGAH